MIDNVPFKLLASGNTLAKVGRQKQIESVAKSKVKIVPQKLPKLSDSGDSPTPP